MPHLILTVTNDLTYDQRMQRIANTLVEAGYRVTLVGRVLPASKPLDNQAFAQVRLRCWWNKGFLFYAEYNLRLFVWLLRQRFDAVGSVDFDTLAAGCLASLLRRKKRVFDAHEHFTEVPELVGRPRVQHFWKTVARLCLPHYRHAYTVGPGIAGLLEQEYGLPFAVVRNVPLAKPLPNRPSGQSANRPFVLYQGALNEGRGIEALLESVTDWPENLQLRLAGEGDLSAQLRARAQELGLGERVQFLGFVKPADLPALTNAAWLGLNLLENKGLSYYYSLANKFFDYVQACVPVLTMDFPEYRALNAEHEVAVLLSDLNPKRIADVISHLWEHPEVYERLQNNCSQARQQWTWEQEKTVLLAVWVEALSSG